MRKMVEIEPVDVHCRATTPLARDGLDMDMADASI